ncbi:MAG TPA: hypothetical protein VFL78_00630 [Rhodanobacteraceae bacterium]|nr:hypothetical protein [Rhodanobacteraceae bacterium]
MSADKNSDRELFPVHFPNWIPADLVAWLRKCGPKLPAHMRGTYGRLTTDTRMRSVWEWFLSARQNAKNPEHLGASTLCFDVERALTLPRKPGDMTETKRADYFRKVRHHTEALIQLLRGTRYSANAAAYTGHTMGDAIDPDKLADVVTRDLATWGDDEMGHVVAYYVDEDGAHKLPWTYPESELFDMLQEVIDWTHWDDGWDWRLGLASSKPLTHARQPSAKLVYFTCTLYENLARQDMAIPFPELATLANVALKLSAANQVDEETVRKQVRRYQARTGVSAQSDADTAGFAF